MYICEKKKYGYFGEDRSDDVDYWDYMIAIGGPHLEGLNDVKKDLEAINALIENDLDKISDKDFYCLISRFFTVNFTIKELLNVISRVNNAYYDKIELLNTRETFEIHRSYGHGKDLDYLTNKYQVNWVVATARNFRLNPKYNYSQEEINSMEANKQIAILSMFPICVNNVELSYKEQVIDMGGSEESAKLGYIARLFRFYNFNNPGYFDNYYSKLGINFSYFEEGDNDFSKKIDNEICSMIKMRFNREQVLMICRQIVSFLKSEYERMFYSIENSYFYVYSDEERYLSLAKEIVEINNALSLKLEKEDTKNTPKVLRRSYL